MPNKAVVPERDNSIPAVVRTIVPDLPLATY